MVFNSERDWWEYEIPYRGRFYWRIESDRYQDKFNNKIIEYYLK